MTMHIKAALLRGAAPLRPAPERKDVDPAKICLEVKEAVEGLNKVVEEFRKKNDERLSQIEKKREDVITKEEVEKLNKAIDDAQAAVKKRVDELEAKTNRLALVGGAGAVDAVKAAEDFARTARFINNHDVKGFGPEQLAEYKGDLAQYLRRFEVKATTMSVGVDPSGGYLVTPDTSGRMIKKIYESSPMRQLASVVSIGTDALEGPIDNGEVEANWVGEKQTRVQTDTPQLGLWRIPANEIYAYPFVTQKLLDDAAVDIEAWLAMKAADKFARKEATAFISGDGILKPMGLLAKAPTAGADGSRQWDVFQFVASGAAGAFATEDPADKLLDLIYTLKAGYRQNARWLMARSTVAAVRKLKDGQGNYIWQPGATAGQPSSLFSYPVAEGEDMPSIAANSLSIAFGDFAEAYTIVDRLGTSVVRDNITAPGFVKFHFRRRVGGGVVNGEAVKILKFAA